MSEMKPHVVLLPHEHHLIGHGARAGMESLASHDPRFGSALLGVLGVETGQLNDLLTDAEDQR